MGNTGDNVTAMLTVCLGAIALAKSLQMNESLLRLAWDGNKTTLLGFGLSFHF